MARRLYLPDRVASQPFDANDGTELTPYKLGMGVVNTFDLGSGSIWADMPASPGPNDTVTVKNARGQYFFSTEDHKLTINANGHELEVPGLNDTGSFLPTTGSFATSHPRFATRWIFVDGNPNGTWVIDQDYGAGAAITRVSAEYTIHPSELVLVDSTAFDIQITIPEGLPNDSWFTVVKQTGDTNLVQITASGTELLWPPSTWISNAIQEISLFYRGESVTYVKTGNTWHPVSSAVEEYFEIWYLLATPVDLTPGQSLLNIEIHPAFNRSLIFDMNTNGLLRVQQNLTGDILLGVDIQAEFLHTMVGNNDDAWARVTPVVSNPHINDIGVPINTAFAHSRPGNYGDTRQSTSLFSISGGETIGIYGEQVPTEGIGTSDIEGMLVVFRV